MVCFKYAQMSASQVAEDIELSNCRPTSEKLIQRLGEKSSEIYLEHECEWEYALPEMSEPIVFISTGVDGTTSHIRGEGYRETMCGTISLYNKLGGRVHTIYVACAPEMGKEDFMLVMMWEIMKLKKLYPDVLYIGLADGAKWNWLFLQAYVTIQILDFYHASERLGKIAPFMCTTKKQAKAWLDAACSDMKHKRGGAKKLLAEMKLRYKSKPATELKEAITYFENNLHRMEYSRYQKLGYPIGSGVTEAACKVIAKQRLSKSGMRWNIEGAQNMLALRGLACTKGRWNQFWEHHMRA
jgi:hypothetical protein